MTTSLIQTQILIALDLRECRGEGRTVEDVAKHVELDETNTKRHLYALQRDGLCKLAPLAGEWTVTAAGWRHTRHGDPI